MTVIEIVADVARRFEDLGIPYAVGGSLASSTWGQMRQTNDADIAIRLSESAVDELLASFSEPYLLSREEIEGALSSNGMFRSAQLLHMDEAFKIDLFILRDAPYAHSELERAIAVEVLPGISVKFYAPENIVLAKLRWFVLGNRISDRQWNDIVQVLEIQSDRIDSEYLEFWAKHFGVFDLLTDAMAQAYP